MVVIQCRCFAGLFFRCVVRRQFAVNNLSQLWRSCHHPGILHSSVTYIHCHNLILLTLNKFRHCFLSEQNHTSCYIHCFHVTCQWLTVRYKNAVIYNNRISRSIITTNVIRLFLTHKRKYVGIDQYVYPLIFI